MKTDRRSFEPQRTFRRARRLSAFVWGIGLGTSSTYFGDRRLGRQRRALAGDKLTHVARLGNRELRKTERDLHQSRSRVSGPGCGPSLHPEQVDDDILVERVRAALGRTCSHPSAISRACVAGKGLLEGMVLEREHLPVVRSAARTRGVREVEDRLQRHLHPGSVPGLQDGQRRERNVGRHGAPLWRHHENQRPDGQSRRHASPGGRKDGSGQRGLLACPRCDGAGDRDDHGPRHRRARRGRRLARASSGAWGTS